MPICVETSTMIFSTSGSVGAVLVIARPRLLAEAPHLAEPVGHGRLLALALADAPADVEAGEVAHRERPHREPEVVEHPVHLVRQGALKDELLGLVAALMEHAVADETVADAHEHGHLV